MPFLSGLLVVESFLCFERDWSVVVSYAQNDMNCLLLVGKDESKISNAFARKKDENNILLPEIKLSNEMR